MNTSATDERAIVFGRYQFLPQRGELLADDGRQVPLGFRAMLVLQALLCASGRILSQRDLLAQVWPGQEVHEANLRVQIAALRKALDDGHKLIRNVTGRGYLFTGRLRSEDDAAPVHEAAVSPARALPLPVTPLLGRAEQQGFLAARMMRDRLLTLTGGAGIGKTTLALALAHGSRPEFGGCVSWVALDAIAEGCPVANAIAAALALPAPCPAQQLASRIGTHRTLLVLDNCEHLAEECAEVASVLLQSCPGLRILATSRRPLLAAAESVYRVPPLELPPEGEQDPDVLGVSPAVQLFMARVQAANGIFRPDDHALAGIGTICRQLDGIPLAIELAAARAGTRGIDEIVAGLEDMMALLRGGRRTAPARQQTLTAALDWSIALLPEPARQLLQHLAARRGSFSLASVRNLPHSQGMSDCEIRSSLDCLVAHSLVLAEPPRQPDHYRLLATTRAYVLGRPENLIAKAVAAGGRTPHPPEDHGFM
jgi:predicted ATPase/DNA-binding winged helix-turn-helix (wHTH) protein